jgi:hypothetical protein
VKSGLRAAGLVLLDVGFVLVETGIWYSVFGIWYFSWIASYEVQSSTPSPQKAKGPIGAFRNCRKC